MHTRNSTRRKRIYKSKYIGRFAFGPIQEEFDENFLGPQNVWRRGESNGTTVTMWRRLFVSFLFFLRANSSSGSCRHVCVCAMSNVCHCSCAYEFTVFSSRNRIKASTQICFRKTPLLARSFTRGNATVSPNKIVVRLMHKRSSPSPY